MLQMCSYNSKMRMLSTIILKHSKFGNILHVPVSTTVFTNTRKLFPKFKHINIILLNVCSLEL